MSFNFPNAPTDGQQFVPVLGGPVYVWQDPAWKLASGGVAGGVYIGDLPPPSPVPGQLWFESDTGMTFIWYVDADSSQWVQFNLAGVPSTVAVKTALPHNLLVNGAFLINQEYYGRQFPQPDNLPLRRRPVAGRLHRHWRHRLVERQHLFAQGLDLSAADGGRHRQADAGGRRQHVCISQPIEGAQGWRSCLSHGGRQAARRALWRPRAGRHLFVRWSNGDYTAPTSPPSPFQPPRPMSTASIWFVIPGDTGGPWPGMYGTATGAAFPCHLGLWHRRPDRHPERLDGRRGLAWSGQTNGMATAGNTFDLFDVGLYADPDKSGAAPPVGGARLCGGGRACQRYFTDSLRMEWGMYSTGAQHAWHPVFFPSKCEPHPS